jgi:hypothetical protein
LARPDRR